MYVISCYDGSQHPAPRAYVSKTAATEREAHQVAAQLLGAKNLRGASTWQRYQGGTVFQFGPRSELNEEDFVVIEET